MNSGRLGACATIRTRSSYRATAKSSTSYTIGEKAVRTSARFIWLAAEFRPWRITSVVTGSEVTTSSGVRGVTLRA